MFNHYTFFDLKLKLNGLLEIQVRKDVCVWLKCKKHVILTKETTKVDKDSASFLQTILILY